MYVPWRVLLVMVRPEGIFLLPLVRLVKADNKLSFLLLKLEAHIFEKNMYELQMIVFKFI